jgi:hypothetical protein
MEIKENEKFFFIKTGDSIRQYRKHLIHVSDDPLTDREETIVMLCTRLSEVEAMKLEIVRGNFGQICSYCGDNKERSWGELQEHIRVCPKHPLATALRQLAVVERERAVWTQHAVDEARLKDKAEAEKEAIWQRCEEIARNSCLVPPDGGSPTEDEIASANYVASLIRAEKEKS